MNLNKKQSRLVLMGGVAVLIIVIAVLALTKQPAPPAPNGSGYYDGPWVNRKGDLIDTRTGRVLQKGYVKPSVNQIKTD